VTRAFPTPRLRLALGAYTALWTLGLPVLLLYLWRRARKDADYGRHLGERFGRYPDPVRDTVWIHAVSIGELRSAIPLIRALLDRGERVVVTQFTPAGRRETMRVFASEIAAGRLRSVWVPFEYGWTFRRFFHAFRPKYGLVMEIEIWPRMIMAARAAGIPLFMCNAQYPSKSYTRDTTSTPMRAELMRGFSGALVKSALQRDRFASVGVEDIVVTGELRFAQPIPEDQVAAGLAARARFAPHRRVITIASAVAGEDGLYLDTIREIRARYEADGLPAPLFVYVPRAPERFDEVSDMLDAAGFSVLRRSQAFDGGLAPLGDPAAPDILLGDSLGEMTFYLAMADTVVVGGGFTPKGSHNITEALALQKPAIVGPEIWTIEYPAEEAIAAGVCRRVTPEHLASELTPDVPEPAPEAIRAFLDGHAGAVEKTLAAIPRLIEGAHDTPASLEPKVSSGG